jgi:hypothetical protein
MNITKSLFLAAAMLLGGSMAVKAQTADEVIDKHIKAIGGHDAWAKINSIKMNCTVSANGTEIPVTVTTLNHKGQRMEFNIGGMLCYMVITPKEGWAYYPIQGQTKPEAMTDEQVKQSQDGLDITGSLYDYKQKGNKVTYLGKDNIEGTECHKLKVVQATGKEETIFIDASTNYQVRSVMKVKANGKEAEAVTNYSNYQKLPEGIVYPMAIESDNGPLTVKSVDVNKPVDESIFKPTADAGKK